MKNRLRRQEHSSTRLLLADSFNQPHPFLMTTPMDKTITREGIWPTGSFAAKNHVVAK